MAKVVRPVFEPSSQASLTRKGRRVSRVLRVRAARDATGCRERHRPLDGAARSQAFSRPQRTRALVFDAPTSARIEGGSASPDAPWKSPESFAWIYLEGMHRCRINGVNRGG